MCHRDVLQCFLVELDGYDDMFATLNKALHISYLLVYSKRFFMAC